MRRLALASSGREGTALAIRFDRPLKGKYAASLWLPCSLSTQAGTKRSLRSSPRHNFSLVSSDIQRSRR